MAASQFACVNFLLRRGCIAQIGAPNEVFSVHNVNITSCKMLFRVN